METHPLGRRKAALVRATQVVKPRGETNGAARLQHPQSVRERREDASAPVVLLQILCVVAAQITYRYAGLSYLR